MPNREIVQPGGAGIYPLQGDVTSTAGNSAVRVTGLQGIPLVSGVPSAGAELQYNQNTNQWQPIVNAVMQVNSISISDDYIITVNFVSITWVQFLVNSVVIQTVYEPSSGPVTCNGTPVV